MIEHVQGWIARGVDADLFRNLLYQIEELGIFLLRQEVDLQVEVITPFAQAGRVILADQDEGREEDSFQRNHKRQKDEGKRINVVRARPTIERYPSAKPNDVNPDKPHASTETGDALGNSIRG